MAEKHRTNPKRTVGLPKSPQDAAGMLQWIEEVSKQEQERQKREGGRDLATQIEAFCKEHRVTKAERKKMLLALSKDAHTLSEALAAVRRKR